MTLIKDIVCVLEEWAPLRFQENYDKAGLIVGDCDVKVKRVLITLV